MPGKHLRGLGYSEETIWRIGPEGEGAATHFVAPIIAPATRPAAVADELLVRFAPGVDAAAWSAILAHVGGRAEEVLRGKADGGDGEGTLVRVTLGGGLGIEQAAALLSKLPGVAFAEPDFVHSAQAVSDDPGYSSGTLWGMYGDATDPANVYGSQAGEAWAADWTGSSRVAIGVIDSGVDYTHPDLYLNIWLNPGEIPASLRPVLSDVDGDAIVTFRDLNHAANAAHVSDLNANGRIDAGDLLQDARWENGADDDANGYLDDLIGWDFLNGDNDPADDNGHGTHVAGTIAAIGGNGAGVAGVAWSAQIVALKFLGADGSGWTSGAMEAVDYYTAASQAAPPQMTFAATNNSWGGGGYSQALFDAIVRGARADILFVAAAGNGGSDRVGDDNDVTESYPANYDTTAAVGYDAVISVGSITSSGALSGFSNFGAATVEIVAPGSSVQSTVPGGGYATYSGTSMAAPHVSGAIALYAARNPAASAAEARADLLATAAATASVDGKVVSGGRLDAYGFAANAAPVVLTGTANVDTLLGGRHGDALHGGDGDDALFGGDGNDMLDGGTGADRAEGGAGNDTYIVDAASDQVVERAGEGEADEVRTSLGVYVLPDDVEILTFLPALAGPADARGNGADNRIGGTASHDFFRLQDGGEDDVAGGDGNDTFYMGAALSARDALNGGSGLDQLALQGDYSAGLTFAAANLAGIEMLALLSGLDTRFGDIAGSLHDYRLVAVDGMVAAGQRLTIDAAQLAPGEDLVFDGSAETDGSFYIYAGKGTDNLRGGGQTDVFLFRSDGRFTAADRLDGGGGLDQLALRGDYTGANAVVMQAGTMAGIEILAILSGNNTYYGPNAGDFSYDIVMHDMNVAAGATLIVDAAQLRTGETLVFDGRTETDGTFRVYGGAGSDRLTAGAGNDLVNGRAGSDIVSGGPGSDRLTGGAGADIFVFDAALGASNVDEIEDFDPAEDGVRLSREIFPALHSDGTLAAGAFHAGTAAADGEDRIVYDSATGRIFYDPDGSGAAEAVLFATVSPGTALTHLDFSAYTPGA